MNSWKRFLYGGIGALMPIILTVVTLDFVTLASKPGTFSTLNIVGIFIRYSALFFVGGFIAYLHNTENQAFKLFEIGISAPALITSLVAVNIGKSEPLPKAAFLEPAKLFLQIGSAYAAENTSKDTATSTESGSWSQIFDGITGKAYSKLNALPSSSGWVPAKGGDIPAGAVKGGQEHPPGSEDLYVCRASLNDGIHPGKVRPAFKGCDVPFGGSEYTMPDYQVLTGEYRWVPANGGNIPAGALKAGRESSPSEVLFICRADYRSGTHPGKIRALFGGCNISWGGKEYTIRSYDVLVKRN